MTDATPAATEPQAMPDDPGWWWRSDSDLGLVKGETQFAVNFVRWETRGNEVFFQWGEDAKLAVLPIDEFRKIFGGGWSRIAPLMGNEGGTTLVIMTNNTAVTEPLYGDAALELFFSGSSIPVTVVIWATAMRNNYENKLATLRAELAQARSNESSWRAGYTSACTERDEVREWWMGVIGERDTLRAENEQLRAQLEQAQASGPEPDWSAAPEWAEWWAMDANGVNGFYEIEPWRNDTSWCITWLNGLITKFRIADKGNVPLGIDWRTLKRKRGAQC